MSTASSRIQIDQYLSTRRRTLFSLRKRLQIPSVRKNTLSPEERAQALLDIKVDDRVGMWGVAQVRQRLANRGVLMSRYAITFHPSFLLTRTDARY